MKIASTLALMIAAFLGFASPASAQLFQNQHVSEMLMSGTNADNRPCVFFYTVGIGQWMAVPLTHLFINAEIAVLISSAEDTSHSIQFGTPATVFFTYSVGAPVDNCSNLPEATIQLQGQKQ